MENKDIVIITLIVLIFYLAYRQIQSKSLNIQSDSQELQDLKQQVSHCQTLYQKRVEKDLGGEELAKVHQQKIKDLESSLLNLAQQKVKGNKEWRNDQTILQKVQEFRTLIEKTDSNSIDRNKINEIEKLAKQITQPSVKAIANQVITDSAYVLGHRNILKKVEVRETELDHAKRTFNQQLREINILFDDQAKDYETIEFNGLYSLLQQIAERERERESKSKWRPFSRSSIQSPKEKEEIETMKLEIQKLQEQVKQKHEAGKQAMEKIKEKNKKIEELEKKLQEK